MQKSLKPGRLEQLHAACGQGLDPDGDVEDPVLGGVLGGLVLLSDASVGVVVQVVKGKRAC